MKIFFINPPDFNTISAELPVAIQEAKGYNPPLGLLYLAGYLEKYSNHDLKFLDCQAEELGYEEIEEAIKNFSPNVVAITAMTFTLIDVIKVLKIVKKVNPAIKTVLGGPHPHIYPEETISIKEVDFVVLGEGEKIFKELLESIDNREKLKNLKGLVFKEGDKIFNNGLADFIKDLDSLPFPARHLTSYKKYTSVLSSQKIVTTAFTSRGCPYRCLFCDRPNLGKMFRCRSAKNVVDEFELCKKMGIDEVLIYDDTFTVNRQRVADICDEIIRRGLHIGWDIRARVDTIDLELLKKMKQAGCMRIHYGIESGTEKILKVLRKGITLEKAKEAVALTKKVGIETLAYFMIGAPTETKEDIEETISFMKELNPDFVHITILTPFPATDLYSLGLERGILHNDYWREFAKNPTSDFKPYFWEENLTRGELEKYLKKAYKLFYLRPNYILRTLSKIKSFKEFKRKARAGLKILTLINN